ncbi:uncharacterized protein LOC119673118 [Teleopsis dalmanni]|uniref:uncharacterized protein LOC119673118 n=1 Tax=Teleopsis dalmanni TaxID=139649 RepID=UPI0018CCA24A|nr:uncharacterized protein LOC119673118 [Teleopsis dalmanni]
MLNRYIDIIYFLIIITNVFQFTANYNLLSINTTNFYIDQCPGIEVQDITDNAESYEVALVLYYVSWSDDSRSTISTYEELTKYYDNHIYFAAIDCWHLSCNCSKPHTGWGEPKQWPTLIVYYGQNTVFPYNGKWDFASLTNFLNTLIKPIERVHSKDELEELALKTDAVILGLFPNANVVKFQHFLTASIKWLEIDPQRVYRFAVVLGDTAYDVISGMDTKMPLIMAVRNNRLELFNKTTKWKPYKILTWLQKDIKPKLTISYGYASITALGTQIKSETVLAIFVNKLPFNKHFYTIMDKEMHNINKVNRHYQNCKDFHKKQNNNNPSTAIVKRQMYEIIQRSLRSPGHCANLEQLNAYQLIYYYEINEFLRNRLNMFSPAAHKTYDESSTDKLLNLYTQYKCLTHPDVNTIEIKTAVSKFIKKASNKLWQKSSVQRTNRTLSVMILEAEEYESFFDLHGIPNIKSNTATSIIIEVSKERVFLMQENFKFEALIRFMKNYYENNLSPYYRTANVVQPLPPALNTVYLQNYNRQMFLNFIQQHNTTLVVLLYSPSCALSAIISHTLIQLSAMVDSTVKFIRLNTKSNHLPWEFVMFTSPTLIVFPRGKTSESRVFPSYLKADVKNVYGFILAQLGPIDQLKLIMSNCQRIIQPTRLNKCLEFARSRVMRHIGNHLKFWQIFENERKLIFERLKVFKDISLSIHQSVKL